MPYEKTTRFFSVFIRRTYGDLPSIRLVVRDKDEGGAINRAVRETWGHAAYFDAETQRVRWSNGHKFKRMYKHDAVAITGALKITVKEVSNGIGN